MVGWGGGEEIYGTRNYNSLILVIRPKFGFPLHVYSGVVMKLKLYFFLPRIVSDQFLIDTLHLCLCCNDTQMLEDWNTLQPPTLDIWVEG